MSAFDELILEQVLVRREAFGAPHGKHSQRRDVQGRDTYTLCVSEARSQEETVSKESMFIAW